MSIKTILFATTCYALAVFIHNAEATERGNPMNNATNQQQSQAQNAIAGANASGGLGGAGGYVYNDSERNPVATASGSFSNTTAECRYLQANSFQFVVFGTQNTSMLRDLVCTLSKPLTDEQKLALCLESSDYRKVRSHLNQPCEIK